MGWIIFIFIVTIALLIYIYIKINRLDEIKKFKYNGKKIYSFLSSNNNNNTKLVDSICNKDTEFAIDTCEIHCGKDFVWKHFDDDDPVSGLKRNSTPELGHCLRVKSTLDNDNIPCTIANGGKKIFTLKNTGVFGFVCQCDDVLKYTNDPITGDCTLRLGCENGQYDSNGECQCNDSFSLKMDAFDIPRCERQSWYKTHSDYAIDKSFVDAKYLSMIDEKINLPNPCIRDYISGDIFPNAGHVAITNDIAHCVSDSDMFVTIQMNDDYLKNNGGKYANGLIRYRHIPIGTTRMGNKTWTPEMLEASVPDDMYEAFLKDEHGRSLSKRGFRIPYRDFRLALPYLDPTSVNMGGTGRMYTQFPINKNKYPVPKVYVYHAKTPDPITSYNIGEYLQFLPFFSRANAIETTQRIYNGYLPVQSKFTTCLLPAMWEPNMNFYRPSITTSVHTGKIDPLSDGIQEYMSFPAFCASRDKKRSPNFKSRFSTGLFATFSINGLYYTVTIVPGNDTVLRNDYKRLIDPNYQEKLQVKRALGDVVYLDDDRAFTTDIRLWPQNAFGIDNSEVATPLKTHRMIDDVEKLKTLPSHY